MQVDALVFHANESQASAYWLMGCRICEFTISSENLIFEQVF